MLPDLLREIRQIDIDPYSDCYMIDIIDLRTHLSQDSDQFLTMNDNIIGPLDLNLLLSAHIFAVHNSLCHAARHNQRQHGGLVRSDLRS